MSAGRPPAHGQSYARPRPNITPNRYRSPDWSSGAASGGQTRSARARRPEPVQHIGKYRVVKTIGKGNFAVVKLAKHVPTGRMVAIKIIDKSKMSQTSLHKMCREVRMMKCLEHPNIVKLFEVMETQRTLYLVLEYASGGEIFDYLITHGRMKESDVRAKFRQIISAVHYCHQKHIVHRDLKAENLLMDRNKNIKLADFGFSNEFTLGGKLNTFCGSPPYAAPELFQGKKYTGPEVDAWSLGVILFTLITGSLPFDGHNLKELKERVLKGKYSVPFYVPSDLQRLIKKFLVLNPAKRITVEAAMRDRWLNSGYHGEQLQPHVEPSSEIDNDRVELLVQLGYAREQIEQSLEMERYDEVWAAYHLLGLPLYAPPVDGHVGRPVRRTASELPTGQNIRRPDLADHAATRLAQLSNIGGGATVRLSTVGDSDDEEEEATAETKPAADSRHIAPHWAAVDSDRSFLGNESSSPVPIPLDIPMPNFDSAKSSQDSVLSDSVGATTPRKVPLVNLAGSPTSKRRQPSSRHTPRRPDHPLDSRSDDSPVWVPSSAPTRLANGHQRRGGSPSNSLDMELPSRVQSNKPAVYDGQFAHSRVAALQSQGRSPINVPRSASFNVRHVPLTNLTNRVRNVDMIQEDRSSASTESAPVTKLSYVPQRVAPPPLIRGRETTLGSSPSPPSDDWLPTNASVQPQGVRSRSPADGIAAAVASASAAPTLVGVAETAPPWHVDSSEPYRPSISHEFDSVPAGSTGFSRNVPLRRTVHTVPLSVYQSPAVNQDDISPASTPPTFRCAGSSRRNRGQPSFFGRLAAKFGRKRNPEAEKREAKVTAV